MEELKLRYNHEQDRYGVWNLETGEWYIEGLHCGMLFHALKAGRWMPVRIELREDWYLVGYEDLERLDGLQVRFV